MESTKYHVFHQTLHALNEESPQIGFTTTREECDASTKIFEQRRDNPPWVVGGVLDGIVIESIRPTLREALYPPNY